MGSPMRSVGRCGCTCSACSLRTRVSFLSARPPFGEDKAHPPPPSARAFLFLTSASVRADDRSSSSADLLVSLQVERPRLPAGNFCRSQVPPPHVRRSVDRGTRPRRNSPTPDQTTATTTSAPTANTSSTR